MATRVRKRFSLASYAADLERFHARLNEAHYRGWAGLDEEMGLATIYADHADLFTAEAIDALRGLVAGEGDEAAQARVLLEFAVQQHLAAAVADLTDRVEAAEARAVIIWRGERIPYREAWTRAGDITGRAERNGLAASYMEAVEAINPLRQERLETMHEAVRGLGFADMAEMVRETAGFDPQQLAAQLRGFLLESETVYFAALRRFLAEIDIEQGDATRIDLEHVIRGAAWDAWFDARGMVPALRGTLAGLGIDLDGQRNILLDIERRPLKQQRAFCTPVSVPDDIRLVMKPRGGWDDYAALLHEAGHAEHFAHVAPDLPVAYRLLGDNSLTEGYGLLFERLVGMPAWLEERVGMKESEALAFADFHSFWYLLLVRAQAAQLMYELYLHSGVEPVLAREQFAGMLGLTLGVSYPHESYLASVDDGLYVARYVRAAMVEGSLSAWLRAAYGETWWRSPEAGEALRRSWSRGQQWNADDVIAHLGYDGLDWRPVLRQIRTLLIGEMSGYGGPNITTRAGTRKV
ncbi:MAG TPA: hypothetical protein VFH63_00900 [candidate division Zixibacteria bacterium]|nr:hypothetical protein [candidate division Zixibacteria bacterium]